jgi:glycosyltransferase involved in cell wall biosynthesis
MKILQVVTYYPPYLGGIENSVYNLVKRLKTNGHDVYVITAADPPSLKTENGVFRLPILFKLRGRWGEVPFCPSFLRAVRTFATDVIHVHMPTRLFPDLVTLSELTKARKTPVILHYRLYQDFSSLLLKAFSRLHYSTLGYITFKHASRIIVPNFFYKELLVTVFRIPAGKTCVVPNAVDDEVYDPSRMTASETRKKYNVNEKLVVLFAGRLVTHKGVEHLIRAFRQVISELHDTLLLVAGDGPLEASLRDLVNKFGIRSKVRFLGGVPQASMPELYSAANVFVLPSLFECSSNVLREALAMEKPVIATKVGDAAEVITHQKNGILVEPGKVEELVDAMLYLLTNEKTALQMGRLARKTIQERYSWNVTMKEILDIYSQATLGK